MQIWRTEDLFMIVVGNDKELVRVNEQAHILPLPVPAITEELLQITKQARGLQTPVVGNDDKRLQITEQARVPQPPVEGREKFPSKLMFSRLWS